MAPNISPYFVISIFFAFVGFKHPWKITERAIVYYWGVLHHAMANMHARCCHTRLQACHMSITCTCQTTMWLNPRCHFSPTSGIHMRDGRQTPRSLMTSPFMNASMIWYQNSLKCLAMVRPEANHESMFILFLRLTLLSKRAAMFDRQQCKGLNLWCVWSSSHGFMTEDLWFSLTTAMALKSCKWDYLWWFERKPQLQEL